MDDLLNFHADPTEAELQALTERVRAVFDTEGCDAGARAADALLREYPTSGAVKLVVGSLYFHYLTATLVGAADMEQAAQAVSERCLALFEQAEHECTEVREKLSAKLLHINTLTLLGRHDEAAAIIDTLPAPQLIDPDILRLNLYLAQGRLDDAEALARRGLLSRVSEVSSALMSLATVARRQKRFDEAARLIDTYAAVDGLFGLDRSNGEMLRLMLALDQDDRDAALSAVERYIDARLTLTLDYRDNPFFAGVQTAVLTPQEIADNQRLTLRTLEEDPGYAALRNAPRFRAALDRLRAALPPEN